MIKKLRRRFTGLAMLMTGMALFALLTVLYFAIIMYTYTGIGNAMRVYTLNPTGSVSDDSSSEIELSSFVRNPCIISIDYEGNITRLNYSTSGLSDEEVKETADDVLDYNDGFGTDSESKLFYYKKTENGSIRISLAQSDSYYQTIEFLLIVFTVFYFVVMSIIFCVSTLIIRMSLKPTERAWEQQQNFIADASHELKTPLTVILTNTNILMAHKDDTVSDQMMWVNSTLEESAHMKDLVEKLLLLAKTDNMSQKDMFTSVDMSELITRLSLQYEPIAFENGILLESDIQDGIFTFGEPTALNQVVHILLDNATKYAGVGGRVMLSLRRNQKEIFVTCTNTGDVIPAEDLPHIFERFYRSDKVRTSGKGYGLGLAICKNLIDLHKGTITCTSNTSIGTTFTISLRALNK